MKIKMTVRPYENENNKIVAFANAVINDTFGINDMKVYKTENDYFVAMPSVHNSEKNTYKDVVEGVSHEFHQQLVTAFKEAMASDEKVATLGEKTEAYFIPHANKLVDSQTKIKALASLTVKENKESEKSAFTINNIRIVESSIEGTDYFVGMPSIQTGNEQYPSKNLCYVTKSNQQFVNRLILKSAREALEDKKKELSDVIAEADKTSHQMNEGLSNEQEHKQSKEEICH